jgi:hypothetical protein
MAIFDRFGHFFFEKNRAWLFFCLLSAPFFLTLALLAPRFFMLRELEQTFDAAALRGRSALEKRMEKERFLRRYSDFEPYFIDQQLESLPLLQRELAELQIKKNHPACSDYGSVCRRIEWLQGPENRLAFAEENIRSSQRIKETEERLLHPVEVDVDDLERLLSLIEGAPIGQYTPHPRSPQLLIEDFILSKKDRAIYELNLTLIKREFTDSHEKKN